MISPAVSPAAIRRWMKAFTRVRERRVGLVEGLVADGAHDLRLELGERRMPVARESRRRQRQPGEGGGEQLHDASARSMFFVSSAVVARP